MRLGIVQHSFGHQSSIQDTMERAHTLGCQVFMTSGPIPLAEREEYKEMLHRFQMEIIIGWVGRLIENGSNQPMAAFEQTLKDIHSYFGVRVIPVSTSYHRWRTDPPLQEQLERLSDAFRILCPVAEAYGMTIAIENVGHRAKDLLQLLEMVDRDSLRIQLDTGNPFVVAEEPVDAARALAPYVVSTHIKDMTIRPITDGEWCKVAGTEIGEGDVDIKGIAHLLYERAHSSETLPFVLEIEPPAGADYLRMCDESVQYVKSELSQIVSFR